MNLTFRGSELRDGEWGTLARQEFTGAANDAHRLNLAPYRERMALGGVNLGLALQSLTRDVAEIKGLLSNKA